MSKRSGEYYGPASRRASARGRAAPHPTSTSWAPCSSSWGCRSPSSTSRRGPATRPHCLFNGVPVYGDERLEVPSPYAPSPPPATLSLTIVEAPYPALVPRAGIPNAHPPRTTSRGHLLASPALYTRRILVPDILYTRSRLSVPSQLHQTANSKVAVSGPASRAFSSPPSKLATTSSSWPTSCGTW